MHACSVWNHRYLWWNVQAASSGSGYKPHYSTANPNPFESLSLATKVVIYVLALLLVLFLGVGCMVTACGCTWVYTRNRRTGLSAHPNLQ